MEGEGRREELGPCRSVRGRLYAIRMSVGKYPHLEFPPSRPYGAYHIALFFTFIFAYSSEYNGLNINRSIHVNKN